jgi:hypothetical protein
MQDLSAKTSTADDMGVSSMRLPRLDPGRRIWISSTCGPALIKTADGLPELDSDFALIGLHLPWRTTTLAPLSSNRRSRR